jgi:hypothetical protein
MKEQDGPFGGGEDTVGQFGDVSGTFGDGRIHDACVEAEIERRGI